jgi:hypothetical protein
MKKLTLAFIILLICSCTKEKKTVELLSFYVDQETRVDNDTLLPVLHYWMYVSVDNDGTCLLQVKNYDTAPRYCKLQLKSSMVDQLFSLCDSVNQDTVMVCKTNSGVCIYDGPGITLIKKNSSGKDVYIHFIDSKRSNPTSYAFYQYIDSIAENIKHSNIADTTEIALKTTNCCKQVYEKIKPDIPIGFRSKFKFTEPVIRPD